MTTIPREKQAPVAFRDQPLEAELDARGDSRGLTAKRDLERYYHILSRGLALAAGMLSPAEALAIVDTLNGTWMDAANSHLVWAEVEDNEGLGARHGIDQAVLVDKLRALPTHAQLAIVDAAERYWQAEDDARASILASLGKAG